MCIAAWGPTEAEVLRVPVGKPVMIDGKRSPGEWEDSEQWECAGVARLRAKQSKEYVWLAVELTNAPDGAVDLYLTTGDGAVYDLHSSAKLGERRLQGTVWPDWTWWNNQDWVANVSRVESFEKRTFLPTGVREFQIAKTRFPGQHWKVMFEVLTPATPEWKTTSCPAGSSNRNSKGWLDLVLSLKKQRQGPLPAW